MNKVIGTSVNRLDGQAKVTGTAIYAAEHQIPDLVHGYLITSTIANGQIETIDTNEAQKSEGVIKIFTHLNSPKIHTPSNDYVKSKISEARLPLSDDKIHYGGQIIGLVVAETFEQAREAASKVKIKYNTQTPILKTEQTTLRKSPPQMGEEFGFSEGDIVAGLASAFAVVEATYITSIQLHAAMEPHAIIAHWHDSDSLTVYEPSQWVKGGQATYAELFGLPVDNVRLITPYIGGGFGSKVFPWPHGILTVAVAREIERPLKVVLSRRQMTANAGHRPTTEQTIRLGATKEGKLTTISHEVKSYCSTVEDFTEPCTHITPVMYKVDNLYLQQNIGARNIGTATFMRGPGENPGLFALESAIDELAWELKIDPLLLRLKNETHEHLSQKLPFSAKYFTDCLKVGAQQFGWKNRPMQTRSLTPDGLLVGWGMAGATYPAYRGKASIKVCLLPDGTAQVFTAANDMGTGAYTVIAITAAETLGLPVEKIQVAIGDSLLPDCGMAGSSMMTASVVPAVTLACQNLLKTANCTTASQACSVLKASGKASFEATASTEPGAESQQWAFQSWGAHFCEITLDEEIGRLQITRWVSVINVGQIINAKAASSQVRGGVIMGIGHALMEECQFDPNIGYPVVYDLATYHYPVHADIPRIDVTFVGEPDFNFNSIGARGVGELPITGVSAALSNAVYHATGKRIRSLPLTPEKLMA